ncbi:TetR/AcrR family transcriptional regulator [Cellulomonas sp. URHD0024]|uniref:TetR/AcrR family transcriptional regulator n=1 Tax=Cellulomonas sp. URHD0024 TaxID=1302620 RepID=UPI00040B86AA|nr:TetR/AcrR family transcriptional regulator [Cellulomonas sp. URHD0024]
MPSPNRNRGPSAAEENRNALVDAARRVLAESGSAAPFSSIAREAGVGQGSLYRHFPNRAELTLVVFEENLAQLGELAGERTTSLADFVRAVVRQAIDSVGFGEVAGGLVDDDALRPFESRFRAMAATVLARHTDQGATPILSVDDFLLAIRVVTSVLSMTRVDDRVRIADEVLRLLAPTIGPVRVA